MANFPKRSDILEQLQKLTIDPTSTRTWVPYNAYVEFLHTKEPIIQDEVVMTAFRDAIQDEKNAILFKGATVLEVGCGIAILSMWVAKQGAARVFAVDAGDVAQAARQVVRENRLDHVIEVMQANIEELELPPVDVIISKWMGACLVYGTTLDQVLYARDKWLKPTGHIFPEKAKLYLSIADDKNSQKPKYFWKKFEGMDMHRAALAVERTGKVTEVLPEQMISNPEEIWQMDLRTLKREEVCFKSSFRILSERRDIADLFVIHFDFAFPAGTNAMIVNTSPWNLTTQWMQTVLHVDQHLPVYAGDHLSGTISMWRTAKDLDIDIHWSFSNELVSIKNHQQSFRMFGWDQAKPQDEDQ
ncbi:protein arginine N-methyltransferase 1-like [Drosophila miranda]|uniref:protein arginine N-methyltransferase 1-like n=1 Tax=Drosophila miranda TaxID=7229 RepID=UPI0007E7CC7E|nr:protein arginine N-methyltransferase 1-like [Drosophila miranda]